MNFAQLLAIVCGCCAAADVDATFSGKEKVAALCAHVLACADASEGDKQAAAALFAMVDK